MDLGVSLENNFSVTKVFFFFFVFHNTLKMIFVCFCFLRAMTILFPHWFVAYVFIYGQNIMFNLPNNFFGHHRRLDTLNGQVYCGVGLG